MSWLFELWPALVAGVALLLLVVLLLKRRRSARPVVPREELDARDPLRRWCQVATKLVTRDCDYGHLSRGEARRMLQRWWHVHGERELHDTLAGLANSPHPDNAWELLRFILVARLGAAAQMVGDDASWSMVGPIAARLQGAYHDWVAMGQAYLTARRQWQGLALDGSEDDAATLWVAENLQALRAGPWTEIPWDLDLENT